MLAEPLAEPAATAEQQHEHQARDDRRDRERQIDEGDKQLPAREAEPGDGPGSGQPEQQVQGHRAERHQGGQPQGAQGIRLADGVPEEGQTRAQRLDEDGGQRQQQQGGKPAQTDGDQQPFDPDRFMGHRGMTRRGGRSGLLGLIEMCSRGVHIRLPPMRAQLQACNLLMSNSSTKEMSSMTDAMADAPA